jgi:hypothetical protein
MTRLLVTTWALLLAVLAGCAGRARLPDCRGPLMPINPAAEVRPHE